MSTSSRTERREVTIDDISKRIVEELQHDGRRSYSEIGKTVGLSEAAVRQRVAKLIESGSMQIVAVTNPLQLGFGRQAMIGIRVEGSMMTVADKISEFAEVDYVVVTTGSYDVLAEVVCADDAELLTVMERIREVPGVTQTDTMTYLSLRNQKYNWGTR